MPMTAQQALKRLRREGWLIVRQSGSHIQLVKDGAWITLPHASWRPVARRGAQYSPKGRMGNVPLTIDRILVGR